MSLFCVLLASIKRHYGVMDGVLGYARLHQTETRPSHASAWSLACWLPKQNQNISLAQKLACAALKKMRQFVKQGKRM